MRDRATQSKTRAFARLLTAFCAAFVAVQTIAPSAHATLHNHETCAHSTHGHDHQNSRPSVAGCSGGRGVGVARLASSSHGRLASECALCATIDASRRVVASADSPRSSTIEPLPESTKRVSIEDDVLDFIAERYSSLSPRAPPLRSA